MKILQIHNRFGLREDADQFISIFLYMDQKLAGDTHERSNIVPQRRDVFEPGSTQSDIEWSEVNIFVAEYLYVSSKRFLSLTPMTTTSFYIFFCRLELQKAFLDCVNFQNHKTNKIRYF